MIRFVLSCIVLSMLACNDAGEHKTAAGTTDSTRPAAVNTEVKKPADTVINTDPYALTPEEMKDDSVFSDGSRPTGWSVAGIDGPVSFKMFLKRLRYWVAQDMKDSVVAVIGFPLQNPRVKTAQQFLPEYDTYINTKVKNALKAQSLSQLFRNVNGVMIGRGELWLGETEHGYRIIGINNK